MFNNVIGLWLVINVAIGIAAVMTYYESRHDG